VVGVAAATTVFGTAEVHATAEAFVDKSVDTHNKAWKIIL
jgi:hypothetical protein